MLLPQSRPRICEHKRTVGSRFRRFSFNESAQGALGVEFALLAPVLILLLSGVMYYGAMFATIHGVQQLAAEAARASIGGLSATERSSLARSYVSEHAEAYPLLDSAKLTVAAGAAAGDADTFEVVVRYDASDQAMFALADMLRLPTMSLERRAVIQRGGY